MSQVSPYVRSAAESRQNRYATILFVVVSGAIFLAAIWLTTPEFFSWAFVENESLNETLGEVTNAEPAPEPRVNEENNGTDWAARVVAIEQQLPDSDATDFAELEIRLQSLRRIVEGERFSSEPVASIQNSLDELRQQAVMLSALSSRPNVDTEAFAGGIASAAHEMQLAEQESLRRTRENAERQARQRKEPALRDVRLALRDNQDEATDLRRQISQMQREQSEVDAKAARAAALQRDMVDVKRYLQPFTAPGYLQPKSERNAWDTQRTVDAKPVSLTRLKRLGALDDTMEGLERLYIFGGGKNPVLNNSRPLGSFPQYWAQHLSKPEVQRAVKRAQQLLRDHGQALVEEQLLSP